MTNFSVQFPKSAAFVLGLISAMGLAPLGLWPLSLVALVLTMELVFRAQTVRGALLRGYAFGLGHFIVGLNWIAGSFRYQDSMPVWLGWFAVAALSLYLAVYPAMATGLAWRYGKGHPLRFGLFLATAWIITEWLRATVFTGFPWNPLGILLVDFAAPTRWIGSYGMSGLLLVLVGGLWGLARRDLRTATGLLGASALIWAGAWFEQNLAGRNALDGASETAIVRAVQPNIGQQDKYKPGYEAANFAKLEELTGPAKPYPRLILWPEAAIPDFLDTEIWARTRVASLLGGKDVLLTGGDKLVFDNRDRVIGAHNSAFALSANAEVLGRYDKAHLVPYGEYLALRWLLEPLGATRLVPGGLDFLPGPGPRSLIIPGFGKVGVQICYEIIFSGEVANRKNRPDFIFNPSNDAWFGSWGPPQFVAQAQLRAAEEGLPVVRSTPTGISVIIDAKGQIIRALPYQQPGFIEASMPVAHAPTLFARFGNFLSLGFALILTLIAIALGRRVV
jgi:apolipoprotein N-acyltransferase